MNAKNTADNPTGNIIMHYNNRYYRSVLYFERSPYFKDISLIDMIFIFQYGQKGELKQFLCLQI